MTERLVLAWSEVLDIDPSEIDEDDSFFEIGGDSATSIRLAGVAQEKNLDLDAETIFKHPTLSDMRQNCKEIDESPPPAGSSESALDQDLVQHCARACHVDPGSIEAIASSPFMQADLFRMHVSADDPGAMQQRFVFELGGIDDPSTVKAAFNVVRDNNQILRTRLVQHEASVVQVVLRDQIQWETASDLAEYLARDITIRSNSGDPLARYAVVHEGKKTFIVWSVQHSAQDEWTRNLLFDGLEQYLQSPATYNKGSRAPPYSMFADYISSSMEAGTAFWRAYLSDAPSRKSLWNVAGNYQPPSYRVEAVQQRKLSYNSQAHGGISLATIAHGAFGLAFAAMSGNLDDSLYLTVRTGRQISLKGVESIMGPMVCLTPLRIQPVPAKSIMDVLQQIQKDSISMMPYEHIARAVLTRETHAVPIFNWRMNNVNLFGRKIFFETGGLKASLKLNAELSPPHLVSSAFYVGARVVKDIIYVEAVYDHNLIKESLLREFVDCFLDILGSMLDRSLKGTVGDLLAEIDKGTTKGSSSEPPLGSSTEA
ncbi:MAG: hypothetical protein L6R40_003126 [Gallowayella cf. fulva]|nr:MAG: hypothetical protein L6R40_003126 [Xanthomendoza cf. fulva]